MWLDSFNDTLFLSSGSDEAWVTAWPELCMLELVKHIGGVGVEIIVKDSGDEGDILASLLLLLEMDPGRYNPELELLLLALVILCELVLLLLLETMEFIERELLLEATLPRWRGGVLSADEPTPSCRMWYSESVSSKLHSLSESKVMDGMWGSRSLWESRECRDRDRFLWRSLLKGGNVGGMEWWRAPPKPLAPPPPKPTNPPGPHKPDDEPNPDESSLPCTFMWIFTCSDMSGSQTGSNTI